MRWLRLNLRNQSNKLLVVRIVFLRVLCDAFFPEAVRSHGSIQTVHRKAARARIVSGFSYVRLPSPNGRGSRERVLSDKETKSEIMLCLLDPHPTHTQRERASFLTINLRFVIDI